MMQLRQSFGWLLFALLAIPVSAQQLSGGSSSLNVPQSLDQLLSTGNQSPFSGSVPADKLKPGVIDLSVDDAINRGLKYNLGLVLSGQATAQAKAARLKELSNILPQINGSLRESASKGNLQAEGFALHIPGVVIANSVRFTNSDARVSLSENLIDLHDIENTRAASANVRAAGYTFNSAKETVTLAVAASYLLVIAAESRVATTMVELKTAEALEQLAQDREAAGLNPNVDTLRARVELQVRRQNLIEANNNLAKQRITLLRVIGLPVHQQIKLVSRVPYKPLPKVSEEDALRRAMATRPDYLATIQQVKAAELQKRAAEAQRIPTLGVNGDYGVLGTHPSNVFPTWTVSAGLKIPIFQGGKIESDILQADAILQQRRAQRDDLKGRIEQDVADAMLDVAAAGEQVEVANATRDYAQQTLTQSQDRFAAGVTNNIEVVQAQEALATANQQYITSLYSHNIAKVLLARSIGAAEQTLRQVLSDDPAPGVQGSAPGNAQGTAPGQAPDNGQGNPAPKK